MGANWSSLLVGCTGKRSQSSVVPRSPQRSLTRKPAGTTTCRCHPRWRARLGDFIAGKGSFRADRKGRRQSVHERCAGLDVRKKNVYACVISMEGTGRKKRKVRSFGTMTADLLKLTAWLHEHGVTHSAMEAIGGFRRPVWASKPHGNVAGETSLHQSFRAGVAA